MRSPSGTSEKPASPSTGTAATQLLKGDAALAQPRTEQVQALPGLAGGSTPLPTPHSRTLTAERAGQRPPSFASARQLALDKSLKGPDFNLLSLRVGMQVITAIIFP